jgi:hypothetical protein
MYGCACYWVCGQPVGNFENVGTLRQIMLEWDTMSRDSGRRSNPELFALDTATLVDTLFCGLYGHGCLDYDTQHDRGIEEEWARFDISPQVEMFDHWFVFLAESPLSSRCVFHLWESDLYGECTLEPGEFDRVLKQALEHLYEDYDKVRLTMPERLTEVYVGLVNDKNVYQSVPALKTFRTTYLIGGADSYDPTQQEWEFPPGTYVETEERTLAQGRVIIATTALGQLSEQA